MLFHFGWNGGLAYLSSACNPATKGGGAAGLLFGYGPNPVDGPQGPVFENTVAHELAHQFSATHTFAANNGGCAGNTTVATSYEPGGGSTIMAYANVCAGNFFQRQSDSYFHGKSIEQIVNFAVGSATCSATAPSGNTAPVVTVAAPSYTIPRNTPFALTASATDADGNTLTYNWEQTDAGLAATGSAPSAASTTGANFRSRPYGTNPTRTFPHLSSILTGIPNAYEVLSSVSRTMNFQVTVRDLAPGAGCTDETSVAVTTDATAGPFVVTSQNVVSNWTANGSNTETITWDVANTDVALSCPSVDILFSRDGGLTFPYTLATATPNDGSHIITVPNIPTRGGRVRVQASNNIFFNINTSIINITSTCAANGVTVTPAAAVSEEVGDAALDLTLNPAFGTAITLPITGTLADTDTYGYGAYNNLAVGACHTHDNTFLHDTYRFTVTLAGNYTFTRTGGTDFRCIFNLYSDAYFPNDPCTNFAISNATFNGASTSIGPGYAVPLVPGVFYTLVVGTFNAPTDPPIPANYGINVAVPVGGGLSTAMINPGAGFNYTYVMVNNATGNIVAIDPSSDLSNTTNFPIGDYTVHGLSYSNTIMPATLNAYIGGPFSTLQNDAMFNPAAFCSQLSQNSIAVDITGALPAVMSPLKAFRDNHAVLLKWATTSEQNTSHFDVLRSEDGVHFETLIGRVTAQGNSSSLVNYSITDPTPLSGINYYRLKQVDLDDRSVLSNVAHIDMSQPFTSAAVYPNPAKTTVTLEYITEKAGNVQLMILDSKGAVVYRSQFNAQSGRNLRSLPVTGLAKGIYALQITDGDGTEIKRFIKE